MDHVKVALSRIFFVGVVGYAEHLQNPSRHFGSVRALQTFFDFGISRFNEKKSLSWFVFSHNCQLWGDRILLTAVAIASSIFDHRNPLLLEFVCPSLPSHLVEYVCLARRTPFWRLFH